MRVAQRHRRALIGPPRCRRSTYDGAHVREVLLALRGRRLGRGHRDRGGLFAREREQQHDHHHHHQRRRWRPCPEPGRARVGAAPDQHRGGRHQRVLDWLRRLREQGRPRRGLRHHARPGNGRRRPPRRRQRRRGRDPRLLDPRLRPRAGGGASRRRARHHARPCGGPPGLHGGRHGPLLDGRDHRLESRDRRRARDESHPHRAPPPAWRRPVHGARRGARHRPARHRGGHHPRVLDGGRPALYQRDERAQGWRRTDQALRAAGSQVRAREQHRRRPREPLLGRRLA